MAPSIVDTVSKLQALLQHIADRLKAVPNQPLFMDLEGVNLGRFGSIAIVQILVPPNPTVYLVDVHVLGQQAFDVSIEGQVSLKSVLQATSIFKVIFDCRNDSDALFSNFGIDVKGIIDLQLLEFATRQPRGRFVSGLAKCVEMDLPSNPDWSQIKKNGLKLFAPEAGGKYEVFLERPLPDALVKYCEQDVLLMPELLILYGSRISVDMAIKVQNLTDERIRFSQSAAYNPRDKNKAFGPILGPVSEAELNSTISPEMMILFAGQLDGLCFVFIPRPTGYLVEYSFILNSRNERQIVL